MCLSKLWEMVKDRETWGTAVHGVAKNRYDLATEQYYYMYYLLLLFCKPKTILKLRFLY